MTLGIFYAGPGTFWTDLKGFEQVMLGKLGSESLSSKPKPRSPLVEPASNNR
jgi:hypothetical protein